MAHDQARGDNLDTRCFAQALFEWNEARYGWQHPEYSLRAVELTTAELSVVFARAQQLKTQALHAPEVRA